MEDHSKQMVLHVENVPIPYKFSVPNSIVEAVGNSKNRVYKDTRNSNMELLERFLQLRRNCPSNSFFHIRISTILVYSIFAIPYSLNYTIRC